MKPPTAKLILSAHQVINKSRRTILAACGKLFSLATAAIITSALFMINTPIQAAAENAAGTIAVVDVALDNPLIQITDCARAVRSPNKLTMDRYIKAEGGFQHDNPGARISFRTDAKTITAKLKFTPLHTRMDAVNSTGFYTVDGKIAGSFQRDSKSAEITIALPQNESGSARDYALIMPFGDSVELTGLSLSGGKLFAPAARPQFKYIAYGDSITHGFRAENITKTYPFMVGEKLRWQVVNMGFGSRTAVASDGDAIAACGGNLISILIGFNDFYGNKTLATYAQDIKGMIRNIRKQQPETPIFLITPLWSSEPAWAAGKIGLKLDDYRKTASQVAAESNDKHLYLVDGLSLMDNKLELTTDGIHPNDKGFAQIAERLTAKFNDLTVKLPPTANCRFIQNIKIGQKQTVITYGTSLTAGGAWVGELNRDINMKYPGLLKLINSGEGAKCSIWGLENLKERVLDKKPDTVFIEFSVNDAYTPYQMTPADCKKNLDTMLDRIKLAYPNCEIILMVMNPMVDRHAALRPKLEEFNDIYRNTAKEKNLLLIDHYPAWLAVLNSDRKAFDQLVPDGAHPNLDGCRQIIVPNIIKAIGE